MALSSGSKLGPYEIVSLLGAGGMGEVYRARDPRLNREVAVKVLPGDFLEGEERRERFAREAKLLAALNHPNIAAVYSFEESGGRSVLVMELLEGETLRERLARGRFAPREAFDAAAQVARGLGAAHAKGIVHRDVKPENVFVTRDGLVKVLDFGLAKERPVSEAEAPTAAVLTQPGDVLGTVSYMSPEQLRGAASVDARSDVFSLGVVLYELLSGKRPFDAPSAAETASRILSAEPLPLAMVAPPEAEAIVQKALRKEPEARFENGSAIAKALESARDEIDFRSRLAKGVGIRFSRSARIALVAALAAAGATGAWIWTRRARRAWAREAVPRASALARDGKWAEAFDVAQRARRELPGDAALAALLPDVTDVLTVASEPPGARVLVRRYDSAARVDDGPSREIGATPLKDVAIARGDYILRLEKDGYEPFERTISSAIARSDPRFKTSAIAVAWTLRKAGAVPPRMAFVPGGTYRLVGYGQPTSAQARLGDFFLDRYEVSNRDFAEFVTAGGYGKPALWRATFVKDGRSLPWEAGIRLLVDRTGLPGPRGWSGGRPPDGQEDLPVTGITWYEASAYAGFRGKALPSVFQWEKAARDGVYVITGAWVMPWGLSRGSGDLRANFSGKAALPVSTMPFGMGPYGCYGMAGNASEWILNEVPGGFLTAGGAFGDQPYIFGDYGTRPSFFSSDHLGFRCALGAPGAGGDDGGAPITAREQAPTYPRSSEAEFRAWLSHYRYDRTPLEARVDERVVTPDWTRERVSFAGSDTGTRVPAWLYLPRRARPPFQVIHFVPGSNAYNGEPGNSFIEGGQISPHIRAGRAVFVVDLPGYRGRERPPGYKRPDFKSVAFRESVVREATELRRGLDYLETRPEIDMKKLAFMNVSIGWQGIIFSAIEPRYRTVLLLSDGLYADQVDWVAEANPVNFAPHIRPPKLMLNGRWDEDFAFRTDAEPLFKILREPKKLELYDGGHVPPAEVAVPAVNRWLDETLGPVAR